MNIKFAVGDICEESGDLLVISGNVNLTLSGGAGGAILLKGNESIQSELYQKRTSKIKSGDVISSSPGNLKYKEILHAIVVDPFYDCKIENLEACLQTVSRIIQNKKYTIVKMTILGSGYGNISVDQFYQTLNKVFYNMKGNLIDLTILDGKQEKINQLQLLAEN